MNNYHLLHSATEIKCSSFYIITLYSIYIRDHQPANNCLPMITSACSISSVIIAPALSYSGIEYALRVDGWTSTFIPFLTNDWTWFGLIGARLSQTLLSSLRIASILFVVLVLRLLANNNVLPLITDCGKTCVNLRYIELWVWWDLLCLQPVVLYKMWKN